ncbi:MAG: glycosyltransferase family 2 protein [Phascolarctobacterium sp.]|uniref:glycosyltransferase family 2 protein n=1 Tax=Phascolarctobacterium sp. TaxID=2049039 RepID=UPI0026DAEC7E|nr:glycosyltransferase family 2 protein [Phascolarctobacterium sp.]MDO4922073.1 glycosyltransferase family 2 protein [Phascolarctobacterium sp.]
MLEELCSVIMPVYNSESYVTYSIRSVLEQTYRNIEFIIIDDCSRDKSQAIIEAFAKQDKRIKFIHNSTNLGCAATRNKAIAISKGKYIAFIDSDDIWSKCKLELEINEVKLRKCDLVYTSYTIIDNNNKIIKHRPVPETAPIDSLLKENSICFSSVLLKADVAKKYNMDSRYFHEDYCYLLDLLRDGIVFHGLNNCLVRYRVSDQNRSKNKIKSAKYRWKIYREYLKLNLIDSCKYFISYFFKGIKKYYV